jgi:hypothetical protein
MATAAAGRREAASSSFFSATLGGRDPEVAGAIGRELGRQQHEIELIASENIVSRAVLEAAGSVLTNKYAEGYPGHRYYGGCQYVDEVEMLAIERAKRLFGCGFANVQPHSGASANQAAFMALMQPGDTYMGLSLECGGHLTHGSPANYSGKWFKVVPYKVRRQDHRIDMDEVATLARQHRPKVIIAGGSAYPRFIDFAHFRAIAEEVGAYLMVDMAHFAGLVAGGVHPSPFPHAHVVTTTTHKTLRGPRGAMILTNREDLAKKINSAVFPGMQGGPLMHVVAAKVPRLCAERGRQRQGARRGAVAVGPRPGLGRHRHAPPAGGPASQEAHRQQRREGAEPRQHHHQQEHRAVRSAEADGDLGHPRRVAGRHHARLRGGRVPLHRPHDGRGSGRPCRQRRGRQRQGGGEGQGRGP